MAPLRFVTFSVVSPLLLAASTAYGNAQAAAPGVDPKASAVSASCLAEFNEQRGKAGLGPFKDASPKQLTVSNGNPNVDFWKSVCEGTLQERQGDRKANGSVTGTFMIATQGGPKEDCKAAAEYWKNGAKNFSSIPGAYGAAKEEYNNPQNTSFIGLFNPKADASVECAFVTCPGKAKQAASGAAAGKAAAGGKPDGEAKKDGEAPSDDVQFKLFCVTNPAALQENQSPFTEQQWDKILKVSAANAVAPALLIVTSAVVGGLLI